MKTIMYLHGYNSDGKTGRLLQKLLKDKYRVLAPKLPVNGVEAVNLAQKLVNEENVDLVVGTSLGAFVALNVYSPFKLIINPTMEPSKSLPLIGVDKELAATYKIYEDNYISYVDNEETFLTHAMFGTNDTVVNYRSEFEKYYGKFHVSSIPNGQHRVSETELKHYVIPKINEIMTIETKKLAESSIF